MKAIQTDTKLGQRLREESGEFWSAIAGEDGWVWSQIPNRDWLHAGRIDAVVTADDWRQDVNWEYRQALDELASDDEEGES